MDEQDIFLGDILSSVIGRIWVDWPSMDLPVLPNPCFGPDELGLCLGCIVLPRAWRGAPCAFGLVDGIFDPFLSPYQYLKTIWSEF